MTTLETIRSRIRSQRSELFGRYGIKNLAVFGSFARGDARPDSDVDLLVEFATPVGVEFIDLADQLELILQRRVDLVSRHGIKTKYFESIRSELEYV
jgi:uncharacterized protein